jgi:nicotinate-nucleotide pyrophosphorylase
LYPDVAVAHVRHAITEDLMGDIDVASATTIPEGPRRAATFGARETGVVAGLPVAGAVVEAMCGDEASNSIHPAADRVVGELNHQAPVRDLGLHLVGHMTARLR